MSKQAFRIEGDFQMGRIRQHFTVEVTASDEPGAREALYADMGSRHGVKRREIDIQTVTAVPADKVQDPIVRHRLQA